jgi:parallel beta-helix repeat protein/predicted outer membrane repeat protein
MMALMVCGVTTATTIYVPGDYASIQDAIVASANGDEILVAPGTYTGAGDWVINPLGKAITIRATGTAEETILDGEHARRVVLCNSFEGINTVIDGFTITEGGRYFDNSEDGGGIYCFISSPTITDCTITRNYAANGGGICCDGGSATITGCTFSYNEALNNNTAGGGIYCQSDSSQVTITGCTFTNNRADSGGGIACDYSNPTISGCTFAGNYALSGGGIACHYSNPSITGCAISDNTSHYTGGISCYDSSPTITDCTISGNTAAYSGGISCQDSSSPTITDCIISGNTADYQGGGIRCWDYSSPTITGCTISGNTANEADSGGGIYDGGWSVGPTLMDTVICGNEPDQIDGNWTNNGGNTIVDDECPPVCPDANDDLHVGIADLLLVLENWSGYTGGDVDRNGLVEIKDLLLVLAHWGPCN